MTNLIITQKDYFNYFQALNNLECILKHDFKNVEINESTFIPLAKRTLVIRIKEFVKTIFYKKIRNKNIVETNFKIDLLIQNLKTINTIHSILSQYQFNDSVQKSYYVLRTARTFNRYIRLIKTWNNQDFNKVSFFKRIFSFFDRSLGYFVDRKRIIKVISPSNLPHQFIPINSPEFDRQNLYLFDEVLEEIRGNAFSNCWQLKGTFKKLRIYGGLIDRMKTEPLKEFIRDAGLNGNDKNILKLIKRNRLNPPIDLFGLEDYLEIMSLVSKWDGDKKERIITKLPNYASFTFSYVLDIAPLLKGAINKKLSVENILALGNSIKHYFANNSNLFFELPKVLENITDYVFTYCKDHPKKISWNDCERWLEQILLLATKEKYAYVQTYIAVQLGNSLCKEFPEWCEDIILFIYNKLNPQKMTEFEVRISILVYGGFLKEIKALRKAGKI